MKIKPEQRINGCKMVGGFKTQSASIQKLVDVIPRIYIDSPTEMAILNVWKRHFEDQDIPYIITEDPKHPRGRLRLWKQLRVPYYNSNAKAIK